MNCKKLYRSITDRKLMGVCGGMAEYFNIDSTLIRVLWVILALCGAVGIAAYIICCFIIPENNGGMTDSAPRYNGDNGGAL